MGDGWSTPRPGRFTLGEKPGTHCIGGWVGPRTGLDGWEKSRLHRDSIPGPSSPSESLCRPKFTAFYKTKTEMFIACVHQCPTLNPFVPLLPFFLSVLLSNSGQSYVFIL